MGESRAMDRIDDIELHESAREQIRHEVDQFAVSLIVHAKALTFQKGERTVTQAHVKDALSEIKKRGEARDKRRNAAAAVGGALLGVFLQEFVLVKMMVESRKARYG